LSVLLAVLISATRQEERSIVCFHMKCSTTQGKLYLSEDPVTEFVPLNCAELWDRVC
jgi:hypothetical protein